MFFVYGPNAMRVSAISSVGYSGGPTINVVVGGAALALNYPSREVAKAEYMRLLALLAKDAGMSESESDTLRAEVLAFMVIDKKPGIVEAVK